MKRIAETEHDTNAEVLAVVGVRPIVVEPQPAVIVALHIEDVQVAVRVKSNRERHIPLDIDVYETLHRRKRETGYVFLDQDHQPFEYHRMERRLTKVCKKSGLRKIGWHILRHTFASHLAMKGVPMTAIQQLMGHSNITTTMRYAHLAPSTLRTAIDMLNPKMIGSAHFGQPVGNEWMRMQQREVVTGNMAPENRVFMG